MEGVARCLLQVSGPLSWRAGVEVVRSEQWQPRKPKMKEMSHLSFFPRKICWEAPAIAHRWRLHALPLVGRGPQRPQRNHKDVTARTSAFRTVSRTVRGRCGLLLDSPALRAGCWGDGRANCCQLGSRSSWMGDLSHGG